MKRRITGSQYFTCFFSSSNITSDTDSSLKRQPVASIDTSVPVSSSSHDLLPPSSSLLSQQSTVTSSNIETSPSDAISDVTESLNAFKPLQQDKTPELNSHFMGSPNRGLGHGIVSAVFCLVYFQLLILSRTNKIWWVMFCYNGTGKSRAILYK